MSKPESFMETITPEKDAKVTSFLDELKKTYNPLPPLFQLYERRGTSQSPNTNTNHVRLLAYRFLVARAWNVKDALQMVNNVVKMRAQRHMDEVAWFPCPFSVRQFDEQDVIKRLAMPAPTVSDPNIARVCSEVSKNLFCGYHGYDKNGFPILYMLLGRAQSAEGINKMKQLTPVGVPYTDTFLNYAAAMGDAGLLLSIYQDMRMLDGSLPDASNPDKHIHAITVVVDLYGLTMGLLWKPALDLLRSMLNFLFENYPECVTRVYVVNCPRMVTFAYSIVRPMLNEHVQKKIIFCGPSDTPKKLDDVIGLSKVPTFLGGKCACPNGCIMNFNPSGAVTATEEDAGGMGDVMTEDVNLKAGQELAKSFGMVAKENISWEFVSTTGKNVNFTVYFTPHGKPGGNTLDESFKPPAEDIVRKDRPMDGADNFVAPVDGVLRLVWDNAHSWLRAKSLQMRVFRIGADGQQKI